MDSKVKKTGDLRRRQDGARNVQRNIRWPDSVDAWLVRQAVKKGFRSPQEYLLHIINEKREAEAAAA